MLMPDPVRKYNFDNQKPFTHSIDTCLVQVGKRPLRRESWAPWVRTGKVALRVTHGEIVWQGAHAAWSVTGSEFKPDLAARICLWSWASL